MKHSYFLFLVCTFFGFGSAGFGQSAHSEQKSSCLERLEHLGEMLAQAEEFLGSGQVSDPCREYYRALLEGYLRVQLSLSDTGNPEALCSVLFSAHIDPILETLSEDSSIECSNCPLLDCRRLDLVFTIDGSASINMNRWLTQLKGAAEAIREKMPTDGSASVCVVQIGGTQAQVELPFVVLDSAATANEVANFLLAEVPKRNGGTPLEDGILTATSQLRSWSSIPDTAVWIEQYGLILVSTDELPPSEPGSPPLPGSKLSVSESLSRAFELGYLDELSALPFAPPCGSGGGTGPFLPQCPQMWCHFVLPQADQPTPQTCPQTNALTPGYVALLKPQSNWQDYANYVCQTVRRVLPSSFVNPWLELLGEPTTISSACPDSGPSTSSGGGH